jgi:hypothetical protein
VGGVWPGAGRARVHDAGGPIVQPVLPDVASNSLLGQFDNLGVAGIDANAIGATAVQVRVVQHGTTAADFYLDYAQATQSPTQLPFAESSGGTRLWQAANEQLRTKGAPLASYTIPIVDLAALDPATWGADCKVVVGGRVRVTDPRLSIALTTRLTELTRNYMVPGDTKITLSNKPDDITGARPEPPPRAPADVAVKITAPAPPVLSASFDASGQLIINSSGDQRTTKQKIAWATGSAPTAATVRAAAPILQQNVSGLATGSVYPAGTTVFISAFAYNARGLELESAPLAVISRTREGSGTSAPPSRRSRSASRPRPLSRRATGPRFLTTTPRRATSGATASSRWK